MTSFLQYGEREEPDDFFENDVSSSFERAAQQLRGSAGPTAEHTVMMASGEAQHDAGKKDNALVSHEPVDGNRAMRFRREGGFTVAHHASLHPPPPSCPPRASRKEKGKGWKTPCLP